MTLYHRSRNNFELAVWVCMQAHLGALVQMFQRELVWHMSAACGIGVYSCEKYSGSLIYDQSCSLAFLCNAFTPASTHRRKLRFVNSHTQL